jgi:hypothetical protein
VGGGTDYERNTSKKRAAYARVAALAGAGGLASCLAIDTTGLMTDRALADAATIDSPSSSEGGSSPPACVIEDAAAPITDGCAPQSKQPSPEYVRCETFDGVDASARIDRSTFVSSPASAVVELPAGDVPRAQTLTLAVTAPPFHKVSMEADVLLSALSAPITVMSIDVTPRSGPAQRFDLVVDASGRLTVRATVPGGILESEVSVDGLCPGRWTHVRVRALYADADGGVDPGMGVEVKTGRPDIDDETSGKVTRTFPTATAPQLGGEAKGTIGIVRDGPSAAVGLHVDNWQLYVY